MGSGLFQYLSIHENIDVKRMRNSNEVSPDDSTWASLEATGGAKYVRSLPQGLETKLDRNKMSGGQCQSVILSRAMMSCSDILFLDEPTKSLDAEHTAAFLQAIKTAKCRQTTVFITHCLRHASIADEILYLEKDGVFEKGTHENLMRNSCGYRRLYDFESASLNIE